MKTLIIVLLVMTYSLTQAEDLILKPEGLICSVSETGKPYPLKHNVAVQVPNHCLDIPLTFKFLEASKFEDDSYKKVNYRLPLSLTIKHSGKSISCYNKSEEVQRLEKYRFTIANEAIIRREVSDGSVNSRDDNKSAGAYRKKMNKPSYQEQNLSYQIINNEIVVANKYLNGKYSFAHNEIRSEDPEVKGSFGTENWYMAKSAKNKNMKAFRAVKDDINFASSVDCGEDVLNESVSNFGIQKSDQSNNTNSGSKSSGQ